MDKNWHPEHFVCKLCEKPITRWETIDIFEKLQKITNKIVITSEQFVEHEGSPVCGKCNTAKLCEKCFQCKKAITGVSKIKNKFNYSSCEALSNW